MVESYLAKQDKRGRRGWGKQRLCPLLLDGRRDLSDAGQVRFGLSRSSSVLCFERVNKTPTVVVLKEEIDSNFMVMVDGVMAPHGDVVDGVDTLCCFEIGRQ